MPYPNEHAARLVDPNAFARFRRQNDKFGPGVHAIFGITKDGKSQLQAIRFDASKFTIDQVRRWLTEHEYKPLLVEKASNTKEGNHSPSDAGAGKSMDDSHEGTRRLLEYCPAGTQMRIDRDRSVLRGVKVLGLESANGRSYSPQSLREAAKLYNGKPVNVDHLEGNRRSYRDRIGKLANVELRGDGLYGDLLVNPKHPLAEQLFWDAEHAPENVGLSHDAHGRTVVRGGRVIVEAIESVRSVDLVAEPATTRSLYEDVEPDANTALADPPDDEPNGKPADSPPKTVDIDKLPDEAFALVLPGGVKIGSRTHPLHKRYWPLHSAEAVKRALVAISRNRKLAEKHRRLAMQRVRDAARKFRIDPDNVGQKESVSMDELDNLTLEQLREARPDLVEQIAATTEADKQLVALKEERDTLKAELEALKRREKLHEALRDAGIEYERVPESLREALEAADDEKRPKLIEDLKRLLGGTQSQKPTSARSGAALPERFEDRVAAWA